MKDLPRSICAKVFCRISGAEQIQCRETDVLGSFRYFRIAGDHWRQFLCVAIISSFCAGSCLAQVSAPAKPEYAIEADVLYRSGDNLTAYMDERCRLDLYAPTGVNQFPTVVWFHGGGLSKGNKSIPLPLKDQGIAVVAANYRLSPSVAAADCIDDAAAAVAWTLQNIDKFGGASSKVFVSGHSAGGYLTSMIGLDKRWLKKYQVDADKIAGLIPFSGHAVTHFAIRAERGIKDTQPTIDEFAPIYHVRKDAPAVLLITGDRDMEMLGRYEENAYFWRMMREVGHQNCELFELEGFNHGQMAEPAFPLLLRFVKSKVVN